MATSRAHRQTKNKRALLYLALIAIVAVTLTALGFINLAPKTVPTSINATLPSLN
jgi:uncharacterized membrane-anchored protein